LQGDIAFSTSANLFGCKVYALLGETRKGYGMWNIEKRRRVELVRPLI
jgi:hypothetical protein